MQLERASIKMLVYVIAESLEGPCKIGIARRPKMRAKDLQPGNSRPLVVQWAIFHEEALRVEKNTHRALASVAIGREWFRISAVEARTAIIAQIDKLFAASHVGLNIGDIIPLKHKLARVANADMDYPDAAPQ